MIDEGNRLKLDIQSKAVQFVNKAHKIDNIIENTDYGGKQINGDKTAPQVLLRCEMCEKSFNNYFFLVFPYKRNKK